MIRICGVEIFRPFTLDATAHILYELQIERSRETARDLVLSFRELARSVSKRSAQRCEPFSASISCS